MRLQQGTLLIGYVFPFKYPFHSFLTVFMFIDHKPPAQDSIFLFWIIDSA
jgi:hypothetical protein